MTRETRFPNTFFPAHVIREAFLTLLSISSLKDVPSGYLSVQIGADTWTYDSIEEFLSGYPKQTGYVRADISRDKLGLTLHFQNKNTQITVKAPRTVRSTRHSPYLKRLLTSIGYRFRQLRQSRRNSKFLLL